jgi:hypothetical protein
MSIANVSGGAGISEIGVDARINARVGKSDACTHDSVFKSFGLVIPLATSIRNTPLHRQDSIIFVH